MKRKVIAFILLIFWLAVGMTPPKQIPLSKESQIKAVFLLNFAQFVEWPASSFPNSRSPFIIGVLGKNPFGSFLDQTVVGEEIKGHRLIVRRYNNVMDIRECNILFINLPDSEELDYVLARLKGRNILTVGDSFRFTRRGGMIQFFTENNRIRMRINPNAAKAADLAISSKLLRLAEID